MSTRRLGLPTCWPACQITPPCAFTNCCPGTGTGKTLLLRLREAHGPPVQNRSALWPSPDGYSGSSGRVQEAIRQEHTTPSRVTDARRHRSRGPLSVLTPALNACTGPMSEPAAPPRARAVDRAPDSVHRLGATASRQKARRPALRSRSAPAPRRAYRASLAGCRSGCALYLADDWIKVHCRCAAASRGSEGACTARLRAVIYRYPPHRAAALASARRPFTNRHGR